MAPTLHPFSDRLQFGLTLLIFYYGIGVAVFRFVERPKELESYKENQHMFDHMKELYSFEHCADPAFENLSFCKDQKVFGTALEAFFATSSTNSLDDRENWTTIGSIFFLTHLSTSIGYGQSHPMTNAGRILCLGFALIGLPIMFYFLSLVQEAELSFIEKFLKKLKLYDEEKSLADDRRRKTQILGVLFLIFLFGGALIYTRLENWNYIEALYFCFVTLSTVGFGDTIPTSNTSKIFSIFYIFLGLGICGGLLAALTGFVGENQNKLTELECLEASGAKACFERDGRDKGSIFIDDHEVDDGFRRQAERIR